jgi:hypothetical protein
MQHFLAFSRLLCLLFDRSCSLNISHAFSTGSLFLGEFSRNRLSPVFVVLFFVFNLSKLSLMHLSASLYPWNSSIRLYTTKSSEPIRFTILLIPLSGFRYYESIDSIQGYKSKSIRANNLEFRRQFFLFLPCYLLVKLNLEGQVGLCKLKLFDSSFFFTAQSTIECTVILYQ